MPNYISILLLQTMEREALRVALKRGAEYILESGGILRKMENFGSRTLPHKIHSHNKNHKTAHCFCLDFDTGLEEFDIIKDKFKRDLDVVKMTFFQQTMKWEKQPMTIPECTIHLDMLPPPYRPEVIKMQQTMDSRTKKLARKKFTLHSHLGYDPF